MKKFKSFAALLLAGGMLMASLAACSGSSSSTAAGAATSTTGTTEGTATADASTINVNIGSEPATIDPALNEAVDGANMILNFFEGLMKWENDGTGIAVVVPGQASDYEKTVNEDGTVTYTFTLRDDIFWSDGQEVVAGDFEYAWKRVVDPATASTYNYVLSMLVNAEEVMAGEVDPSELGITALDDKTLEIVITYDCPYFIEVCAFPTASPVREDMIAQGGDQWTFSTDTFIGNGQYVMSEWSHDEVIRTVKSETYYNKDSIKVDAINWYLMDDANSILTAMRSNELQFTYRNFPVDELPSLIANGEVDIAETLGTYYVAFNNEVEPFDNPLVREAFNLVIDRNYIVDQITQGGELPATAFVPSGMNDVDGGDFRENGGVYDFYSADDAAYQANCERARELLAEAGYEGGAGFPIVTYIYNTTDQHRVIAEALQNMWATELGVTVQLENMDWNAFIETRNNGSFSICRHGWIADYSDPITFIELLVTGGGNNDANYSNEAYDAAVATARSTSVTEDRMTAMHEAEDILIEDSGIAPIFFYTNPYMLDSSLTGLYYTPLGYFFFDQIEAA